MAAVAIALFVASFSFTGGIGAQEEGGIPNLANDASHSLTLRYKGAGAGWSSPSGKAPETVVSTEAHLVEAGWSLRFYSPPEEFKVFWNGELLTQFDGPRACDRRVDSDKNPSCVSGNGHIYDVLMVIGADGTYEISMTTERQVWWCGVIAGDCFVGEHTRFWPPECWEASQDPSYLEKYMPLSGPKCVAQQYQAGDY
jgi:hypothetical protein